jgi:hypothetical protein
MWKIVATKTGVHRWSKISSSLEPTHSKNSDNVSLEDLKKLAKKHKVLSSGKSKNSLALLIFNIRGTGLSTEELKKIVDFLPSKEKRKAKEMVTKQIINPITDYRGLWRPAPKPIDKMTRNQIINNLRKFRDAWEHETGRNQGLSDEMIDSVSDTNLRERLSWYFSETAKNQAANWIRDNQEGNTHSTKTPFEMTDYVARIYNNFKKNKKIKIIKILKGKAALDAIKKVFFGDDKVVAEKWQKEIIWSSRDIANSIFFIYEQKLIKNTIKGCKFVIGHKNGGSVLGQRI